MKRKFAVPLENGVLCSHFGHCTQFAFIDTDGNTVLSETLATPPPHEPGILPLWLYGEQVTDIIAGSSRAARCGPRWPCPLRACSRRPLS